MWPRLVNVAIGCWLLASPGVLGYSGIAATSDIVVGALVASAACIAIWEATRALRWINVPLGAWLVVSPWLLAGGSMAPRVQGLLLGAAIITLATRGGRVTHPYGGGWRAVLDPGRLVPAPGPTPTGDDGLPPGSTTRNDPSPGPESVVGPADHDDSPPPDPPARANDEESAPSWRHRRRRGAKSWW